MASKGRVILESEVNHLILHLLVLLLSLLNVLVMGERRVAIGRFVVQVLRVTNNGVEVEQEVLRSVILGVGSVDLGG
jgi:hypothetical protein